MSYDVSQSVVIFERLTFCVCSHCACLEARREGIPGPAFPLTMVTTEESSSVDHIKMNRCYSSFICEVPSDNWMLVFHFIKTTKTITSLNRRKSINLFRPALFMDKR